MSCVVDSYRCMLKSIFQSAAGGNLPLRCFILRRRCYSSYTVEDDHYKTLGVERGASSKEIKAAFYELSKKYHPDANPADRVKSSAKFQQIADAYEVLGSEDKKRDYDSTLSSNKYTKIVINSPGAPVRRKDYTDLDIDYKDFEHFQQSHRRKRRVFYNDNEMPEFFKGVEWSERFGGIDPRAAAPPKYINYKNSRAFQREEMERKMAEEMEQIRKMSKYPLPTFEDLLRQEQKRKQESASKLAGLASLGLIVVFVVCVCSVKYGY